MADLAGLARQRTNLDERAVDHLRRLVAGWAPVADLSYSDLLLLVPCRSNDTTGAHGIGNPVTGSATPTVTVAHTASAGGAAGHEADSHAGAVAPAAVPGYVVLAHARATTGPTVYPADPVGELRWAASHEWLSAGMEGRSGQALIVGAGVRSPIGDDDMVEEYAGPASPDQRRVLDYAPVRCTDQIVGVLARESSPTLIRRINPLEPVYRDLYDRFVQMIIDGSFPYDRVEQLGEFREPRVGDGVMILDYEARITYASPNATSALHRLGVIDTLPGSRLGDFGLDDTVIRRSFWRRRSTVDEFTAGAHLTVVIRAYPLVADNRITGAMALLRDVSELRHRDRLLVSKDATIREIHHRVKNNLQTVSALLRLQARRLRNVQARAAVDASVRRVSSIAMVHEHLAQETGDTVDFDAMVGPLTRMVEEGLHTAEQPLRIEVTGAAGEIDGEMAMPLAVVLAELVQNAHDHAKPAAEAKQSDKAKKSTEPPGNDVVSVTFKLTGDTLTMAVADRGPGVPEGFSLDRDAGLGLTIVRTFVVNHLRGRLSIRSNSDTAPRGAVVEVTVPRHADPTPVG